MTPSLPDQLRPKRRRRPLTLQSPVFHSFLAVAAASAIFAIDTATTLDTAIAVLYVVVVLVAANILSPRGILMVGLGCLTLTVVSYALSHSVEVDTALVRCLVSLAAIGITTALAMRHKLATIALRGQAELLDLTHDAIFVRDMNDVITYWNRGAEELYGWSKAEAIRQVTHNLTQTIFPEPLEDITAELLRAGRWEGELIHRKRDGSRVTVDSRWALQRDAGGQPRAVLETNTDITKRKRAEEKVLQQEQALQLAIDTIQTLVWRADASGAAEFFNQRWLEYTGLTFESARGWAWGSVIHPDDFPHLTAEWRKILASGKYGEAEGRLRRFDGEYRCFLFRAEPLRDEAGNVISWYGVNIDIEDMKLAQRRSLQAERELRLAIDTIPGMVWSSSANGSVEFVNKRWSEMGLTLEDIRGARWKGLIHPHDLPQMESDWDHAVRTCGPFENVSRVRRADGQYRWLLIRAAALLDETGNPLKWYGIDSDIEDQKRAEEALRRSEAYSLEAQRLSLTGSFGRKTATNELFWSEEMYRIFGYELGVKPTTELALRRVHPDDTALYRGAIESMARGEPDVEVQVRLLMPDGAIKHIRVLAHGTATEEGHAEYVGAVMDVTTAKKAEEALQEAHAALAHVTRVATLGELTASIAHEVNQPLAGIVTNGEAGLRWLGREEPQLDEARSAVQRMIGDARRASEVVRRLRALSRKDSPQKLPIKINDVIDEALPLIQRELSMHRVALKLELGAGLPRVVGDRIQLQQVIINLMINGVQSVSSVAGPRKLIVGSQQSTDRDGVVVTVRDSGTGIDPDVADRLFNAFFSTKPDGMGMGLSICRSIVEAHGGRIWAANNDDGPGATFQVFLPFEDGATQPPPNGVH